MIVRFAEIMEINSLVFSIDSKMKIKISDEVLKIIQKYKQDTKYSLEAGGIILGRYLWSEDVVIDYITVPMDNDKRKKYYFYRNKESHQAEIIKYWRESNGTCNYLGEWHTHPEDIPKPSKYDINQWKKIIKNAQYDNDYLLFLIAGKKQMKIWIGYQDNLNIKELSIYKNKGVKNAKNSS